MANVLLPIQAGDIGQGYCFTTWQQLLVDISNAQKALLPGGMAFYNFGDTTPAPEYQLYPWLYSGDMRWYKYDGSWVSPNPETSADARRIFVGDLTALEKYDGGWPGAVTNRTGPMWEEDTTFQGRVPIGVGLVPGSATPAVTVTAYTAMGAAEHTLTEAEGGQGVHVHPFGVSNPGNDDAFFSRPGLNTTAAYTGYYIGGSGSNIVMAETTADLVTLPSGLAGAGVTAPTPFQVLQPGVGVYIIKRTARVYYKIPNP